MSTLLALERLGKIFCKEDGADFYALKGINLNIGSEHHLISLIGPDGSGKSTLVNYSRQILRLWREFHGVANVNL